MYKVFINELPLIITKKDNKTKRDIKHILNPNKKTIKKIIEEYNKGDIKKKIIIISKNIKKTWSDFLSFFILIEAAGGIVEKDNQILMIYRNNKWDLPKGKRENNEKIKECAIREVKEECGLKNITIHNNFYCTYHTYEFEKKQILKQTYWFEMTSNFNQALIPQLEEGIKKVAWVEINNLDKKLRNSYNSIKDLLKQRNINFFGQERSNISSI